jgi:hypothetical protein
MLLAVGAAHAGQQQDAADARVESISITSGWGGLSPDSPLVTELALKRSGDGYAMTGSQSRAGKKTLLAPVDVPAADVVALANALREPSLSQLPLPELGVPLADVQAQVDSSIHRGIGEDDSPELLARMKDYRESLRDPTVLTATLVKGFSGFHTDDYPGVRITAEFSDGTTWTATSRSQQYLMLPWKREGMDPTYSPGISRSLARLLPVGATNRERLEGPIDESSLQELVASALDDELSRINAESKAGEALRVLEGAFQVEAPREQDPVPAIDLGKVLFADLRLPDGPKNLHMEVRLPLDGSALQDPDGDVARIRKALSLAQSAPGLQARMAEMPDEQFVMSDRFGYAWLNEATAAQFVDQMEQLGKLPELKSSPDLIRDAVMVEVGWSPTYWIVLPDRRAVLWKKYRDDHVVPGTRHCDGLPSKNGTVERWDRGKDLCIGKVYSAEGEELP